MWGGGEWGQQMDREEEGEARRSVRGSAGEKPLWWDDGTDEKSRGREGGGETDGGGRLFSFAVSLLPSNVLCHCNTTPLLRLFKSFHNNKNINNKNDHDNAKKYIYKPQPCLTTLSPQKGGGQALEFI